MELPNLCSGLLKEGTMANVVIALHPDLLTLFPLFSPVLPSLQISLHRVSTACGALLAPCYPLFLPQSPVSFTLWVCLSQKYRCLFLKVFMTRELQSLGHLMHSDIFISFLGHLHQFHLLSNLLPISFSASFLPILAEIHRTKIHRKKKRSKVDAWSCLFL